MKNLIYLSLILLIGCNNTRKNIEIDENLVFDQSSWWLLNLDSLATVDNYFLTIKNLRLKGHKSIKPYIETDHNKRISLCTIRTPRGGGYFWDSRAVLNIFVGKDYTNVYYSLNDSFIRLENHIALQKEVEAFYDTYSRLDFKSQDSIWFKINQYEAEIFVNPIEDTLYHFNKVIEQVALGFQRYKSESGDTSIELQVSIMGNNRNPFKSTNIQNTKKNTRSKNQKGFSDW